MDRLIFPATHPHHVRDYHQFCALVEASALLHHRQRAQLDGCVISTDADVMNAITVSSGILGCESLNLSADAALVFASIPSSGEPITLPWLSQQMPNLSPHRLRHAVDELEAVGRIIQLDIGVITVHGKGGLDAQVPLLPSALAVLRDYLAVRRELVSGPDSGILFLSRSGKPMPAVSVQQWVARLGRTVLGDERRVHPHLFRHSIAVHLLRRGLDIRYIQCFLRHADMDTTKRYLRLVPEHLREDYDNAMPYLAADTSAS